MVFLSPPSAPKQLKKSKLFGILFNGQTLYGGEEEILSLALVFLMVVEVD